MANSQQSSQGRKYVHRSPSVSLDPNRVSDLVHHREDLTDFPLPD